MDNDTYSLGPVLLKKITGVIVGRDGVKECWYRDEGKDYYIPITENEQNYKLGQEVTVSRLVTLQHTKIEGN